MKNSLSRSGSIIVDDNIPETVNDAKQEYNKNVEPPMDIVLADSQGAEYNPCSVHGRRQPPIDNHIINKVLCL